MVDILEYETTSSTGSGLPAARDYAGLVTHALVAAEFRLAKLEGVIHIKPSDLAADQALAVYLTDGDLSNAEIEECIESNQLDPSDRIATEKGRRLVMPMVDGNGTPIFLNPLQTTAGFSMKVNKTFAEGKGWGIGVYGKGTSPPGGMEFSITEKAYGVWIN